MQTLFNFIVIALILCAVPNLLAGLGNILANWRMERDYQKQHRQHRQHRGN